MEWNTHTLMNTPRWIFFFFCARLHFHIQFLLWLLWKWNTLQNTFDINQTHSLILLAPTPRTYPSNFEYTILVVEAKKKIKIRMKSRVNYALWLRNVMCIVNIMTVISIFVSHKFQIKYKKVRWMRRANSTHVEMFRIMHQWKKQFVKRFTKKRVFFLFSVCGITHIYCMFSVSTCVHNIFSSCFDSLFTLVCSTTFANGKAALRTEIYTETTWKMVRYKMQKLDWKR